MGQESESSVLDHPCSPHDLKEAPLPRPSLLPLRMGWSYVIMAGKRRDSEECFLLLHSGVLLPPHCSSASLPPGVP